MDCKLVLFFIVCQLHLGISQIGRDCKVKKDCMPHEFCKVGYCHCQLGYVKNVNYCFKIRHYGQECFFHVQCFDHRMVCQLDDGDPLQIKRCLCDQTGLEDKAGITVQGLHNYGNRSKRFSGMLLNAHIGVTLIMKTLRYHAWNETIHECLQAVNITDMVSALAEGDPGGQIETEAQQVFLGLVIAGLAVVSVILLFILICIVYGCCCRVKNKNRYRDHEEEDRTAKIKEVAIIGVPPLGTYQAIPTDLSLPQH